MRSAWPRGSEWRKWDLHLHAPGTNLNDGFRCDDGEDRWTRFCSILNASDVVAFGITDYFSATAYFSARDAFRERHPGSHKLLLANIELRTSYVVNAKQEEVNLHLLFNPSMPDHDARIHRFLAALKTNKTVDHGRVVHAQELTKESDFAEATTNREFILEALNTTFGASADLTEFVLVFTAANNDGIRPQRGKLRKLAITDELDKFSHGFVGSAANTAHFLNPKRLEDAEQRVAPKPVISGCDAHSFDELEQRLGRVWAGSGGASALCEPTWIKADPTFEGLRQILFEPANRVFIGEEPEIERRLRSNRTRYIESLHITCAQDYTGSHGAWFHDEKIPIGKELVAIIGNKGSGKSALTDIIGLLGNSHNQHAKSANLPRTEELFSFLNKEKFLKGGCARNFVGTLHWHDGEPTTAQLDGSVVRHLPERVEYLPQKYLERLCSNIADDEFRATLNEVIYRYVRKQDQHGRTDLESLIQYLSQQAQAELAVKKAELHSANEEVFEVERKLSDEYLAEIQQRLKVRREDLEAHRAAPVTPCPTPDASTLDPILGQEVTRLARELELLEEQIDAAIEEQVQLTQTVEQLRQLRQSLVRAAAGLTSIRDTHSAAFEAAALRFEDIVDLRIDYGRLDSALASREDRLSVVAGLLSDPEPHAPAPTMDNGAAAATTSLLSRRDQLTARREDLVRQLGQPQRDYETYVAALKVWKSRELEIEGADDAQSTETVRGLESELRRITEDYPKQRAALLKRREDIGRLVFRIKRSLTEFYVSVKRAIDEEIAKCRAQLGDYNLSIEAGLKLSNEFPDEFLKYINQASVGSFKGQEEGRAAIRAICDAVADWEMEDDVFAALRHITDALHWDERPEFAASKPKRNVARQMKGQRTVVELYDHLYSFDFLAPKYDLKVDGKDLSELSPGERGGLLLIFYLMLDRQDIPLIIDQPEDNLDNKSVYEILVTFIKIAKKRRQIVLVTHNPNLAVVADAEQIIHVALDKENRKHEFDFFSGSIEDPRVNEAVVNILEGTLPAFDNRRLKYRGASAGRRPKV